MYEDITDYLMMTRSEMVTAILTLSDKADRAGMTDTAKDLDEVAHKLREKKPSSLMMRLTSPFLGPGA